MWLCTHVSVGMYAHTYTYMQNGYRKLAFIWNLCVIWLILLIRRVLKTTVSSLRMVPVHSWTFNWCAEMPRVVRRYYLSRSDCPECKLWPPFSTKAHGARPCIRMIAWQQPSRVPARAHSGRRFTSTCICPASEEAYVHSPCWTLKVYYSPPHRRASVPCTLHSLIAFAFGAGGRWMMGLIPVWAHSPSTPRIASYGKPPQNALLTPQTLGKAFRFPGKILIFMSFYNKLFPDLGLVIPIQNVCLFSILTTNVSICFKPKHWGLEKTQIFKIRLNQVSSIVVPAQCVDLLRETLSVWRLSYSKEHSC